MAKDKPEVDPRITRRKVTMTSFGTAPNGDPIKHQAVTYVCDERGHVAAFIALMKERGWPSVIVADEPDAGPSGFDGAYYVPPELDVADAGSYYPATPGTETAKANAEIHAAMVADPKITVVSEGN